MDFSHQKPYGLIKFSIDKHCTAHAREISNKRQLTSL